jgi:probable phosphoglycerate mutase
MGHVHESTRLESTCTRFILVRHGETEWNVQERIMGQHDSPLTPRGLEQARALGAALVRYQAAACYSSDLPRAARTAAIIAEATEHRVVLDARLRERAMGLFEGFTPAELEMSAPQARADYRSGGFDYVIPGGESANQQLARTLACLEEWAQRHAGQTVLAVTHGGNLSGLFEHVLGLPFGGSWKFRKPNAAINVFLRRTQGWVLETWGDVSHLDRSAEPAAATPDSGLAFSPPPPAALHLETKTTRD